MSARATREAKSKAKISIQATLSSFYGSKKAEEDDLSRPDPATPRTPSRRRNVKKPPDADALEDVPSPGPSSSTSYKAEPIARLNDPRGKILTSIFDMPIPSLPPNLQGKGKKTLSADAQTGPLDRHFVPNDPIIHVSSSSNRSVIIVEDDSFEGPSPSLEPLKVTTRNLDQIIIIDDNSPTAVKPSQPSHPFFLPKKPKPIFDVDGDVSSPHSPIDLTESPVKSKEKGKPTFSSSAWPNAENQHVRPHFTPEERSLTFNRKNAIPRPSITSPSSPFTPVLNVDIQTTYSKGRLSQPLRSSPIPVEHAAHPALSRLVEPPVSQVPHDLWTEKYKPRRASEVLGNESSVQYLKMWLQELELSLEAPPPSTPSSNVTPNLGDGPRPRKRPRVVRAVDKAQRKRQRRSAYDPFSSDWIVASEDEDEIVLSVDDEVLDVDGGTPIPLTHATASTVGGSSPSASSRNSPLPHGSNFPVLQATHYDFSAHLTNAILISGPPGSGKTASVYACAAELGWSVFETSPGSGKRAGPQIMNILDGVGKNHTLGHGGVINPASPRFKGKSSGSSGKATLDAMFEVRDKRKTFGSVSNPISFDERETGETMSEHPNTQRVGSAARKINQSIILLEEVDVLFQGEGGFWPAVISVIKESHRPVIMTCNDPSLVPQEDLPLQSVLIFEPCSPPLAVSYLRKLSKIEGYELSHPFLHNLYTNTFTRNPFDYPDQAMHPVPSQCPPTPDLRSAILQAQFHCSSAKRLADDGKTLEDPPFSIADQADRYTVVLSSPPQPAGTQNTTHFTMSHQIQSLWAMSESLSLANCLQRRVLDEMEALLIDNYGPLDEDEITQKLNPDDLLGHQILHKPHFRHNAPGIAQYARDDEIANDIITRSNALFTSSISLPHLEHKPSVPDPTSFLDTMKLFDDRAKYQSRALLFLEAILSLSSPLLPRAELFLDYAPFARQMIRSDDAEERADVQALEALEESARLNGVSGRMTRNSLLQKAGLARRRQDFIRYLNLDAHELDAARESGFTEEE